MATKKRTTKKKASKKRASSKKAPARKKTSKKRTSKAKKGRARAFGIQGSVASQLYKRGKLQAKRAAALLAWKKKHPRARVTAKVRAGMPVFNATFVTPKQIAAAASPSSSAASYPATSTAIVRVSDSGSSAIVRRLPSGSTGSSFKDRVLELLRQGYSRGKAWALAMKERREAAGAAGKAAKKRRRKAKRRTAAAATTPATTPRKPKKKRVSKKRRAASKKKRAASQKRTTKKTAAASTTARASQPGKRRAKKGAKRRSKRTGKKRRSSKKGSSGVLHASDSATPATGRGATGRGATGRGATGRGAKVEKIKLMKKFGVPPRKRQSAFERSALRAAAGNAITHKEIMDTLHAEKLVAWVCVGKRRTGCGGGSKSLRGAHQIGIFKRPPK